MFRLTLSIGLFWSCFASLPAHAQLLRCASHQLQTADSKALRKVATQTAGGREILWPSMFACVNRNHSRAGVDVKGEPQPDGSVFEFSLLCERERRPWSCELLHARSARLELELEGRAMTFKLGLPPGFDLQRAKNLVLRAHEVAPTMKDLQMCGQRQQGPPDPRVEEWLHMSQDAFRFSRSPITLGISEEKGIVSVGVEEQILQFAPDPTDETKLNFTCWTFEVIVT